MLKQYYKDKYSKWNQAKPFKGKRGKDYTERNRNEVFVQLMAGDWIDAHENDKEHFLRAMYQRTQTIEMKEILDGDDKFVILRGIAGIGKTSYIDSFVYEWANEEIHNNYDIVIKLTCRELNVLNDIRSLHDLLRRNYPDELSNLLNDSLNESKSKALIILDGLDEFKHLKDIVNMRRGKCSDYPLVSVIYDLINPEFQCNKKVIVCGRPQASESIYRAFQGKLTCKLIEIAGFDEKNANLFIEKFFHGNAHKADDIKQQLLGQEHLKAMLRIPIYAYILCNVFDNGALIEELDTTTKLHIATILVFLREHMRNFHGSNVAFINMCKDETRKRLDKKIIRVCLHISS